MENYGTLRPQSGRWCQRDAGAIPSDFSVRSDQNLGHDLWCPGPCHCLSFLLCLAVLPLWDTQAPPHEAAVQWNTLPALFSSDTPSSPTMPY